MRIFQKKKRRKIRRVRTQMNLYPKFKDWNETLKNYKNQNENTPKYKDQKCIFASLFFFNFIIIVNFLVFFIFFWIFFGFFWGTFWSGLESGSNGSWVESWIRSYPRLEIFFFPFWELTILYIYIYIYFILLVSNLSRDPIWESIFFFFFLIHVQIDVFK